MAYRLVANLSFGFHNKLVITFLQVFNKASLDVNVLTVAESSQNLTQEALYFSLCIQRKFSFPHTTNNTQISELSLPKCGSYLGA